MPQIRAPRRHALAVLCLFGLAAPSGAAEMTMATGKGHAHAASAEKANAAAMQMMMEKMDVRATGNPDKDFARMMIGHHEGAIAMAQVELDYGTDAGLRRLARDIIVAQNKEIAEMKAWLAAHP